MKHKQIQTLQVPKSQFYMAIERCRPMVRHRMSLAAIDGKLDVDMIAADCYLQGIIDGLQLIEQRPYLLTSLGLVATKETAAIIGDSIWL